MHIKRTYFMYEKIYKIIGIISLVLTSTTALAELTRGPYLQQGSATRMAIHWRTSTVEDSKVQFGFQPLQLNEVISDTELTKEHALVLEGLTPNTKYFYSIGDSTQILAGGDEKHFFETPPEAGIPKKTRIWVLGDSGLYNAIGGSSTDVRNGFHTWLQDHDPSFGPHLALMLGDNAYPSGTDIAYQRALFDLYADTLRHCVLWSTLGNHETDQGTGVDSLLQSGVYFETFNFPKHGESGGRPSGSEGYYAFDYGDIHFVCLDSQERDEVYVNTMLEWLHDDLSTTLQKWLIVFFHHPPYTRGSHDSDTRLVNGVLKDLRLKEMREKALPILEVGGVDLVLTGHSHSYERSFFLNGHYGLSSSLDETMIINGGDGNIAGDGPYNKALENGTVNIVCGSSSRIGGSGLNTLDHPVMITSLADLGSMAIDIEKDRLDGYFINDLGQELDHFTIVKGNVAPEAHEDAYNLVSGTFILTIPVANGLLTNDVDFEGGPLTVNRIPVRLPQFGVISLQSNGAFLYARGRGDFTQDSFVYEVIDNGGKTAQATVFIRVVNSADDFEVVHNLSSGSEPLSKISSGPMESSGLNPLSNRSLGVVNGVESSTLSVDAGSNVTIPIDDDFRLNGVVEDDGVNPSTLRSLWTQIKGPCTHPSVEFEDDTALDTKVTFLIPGSYLLRLTVDKGLEQVFDEVLIVVLDNLERVTEGLVTMYSFQEGQGDQILDLSNNGEALDLVIQDPTKTRWLLRGGLSIESPTKIVSTKKASKISESIKKTEEITLEAWVQSKDASQTGPARIVTLSDDSKQLNVSLGQKGSFYDVRLRTIQNPGTKPSLSSPPNSVDLSLTHLVYTRERSGLARLTINGEEVARENISGDLSNWSTDFQLSLAGEVLDNFVRPWIGNFHLVAVYDRALTEDEILTNMNAGIFSNLEEDRTNETLEPKHVNVFQQYIETYSSDVRERIQSSTNVSVLSVQENERGVSLYTNDNLDEESKGEFAIDGNEETQWMGGPAAGGWWMVLAFDQLTELFKVQLLLAEESSSEMLILSSVDTNTWTPVPALLSGDYVLSKYIWIVFPEQEDGAIPQVKEVLWR